MLFLLLTTSDCLAGTGVAGGSASATIPSAVATCKVPTGKNYAGRDFSDTNFSAWPAGSLVGANFSKAKLKGAIFANQDLSGASFDGASFGLGSGGNNPDFTNTNLDRTCFANATGLAGTDLTYAVFHCTDFSNTVLVDAQFGPMQNIKSDAQCRTKFIATTIGIDAINVDNWGSVDFSRARFQGLSPDRFSLAGKNITGAVLQDIDFSNIDMRGANLTRVDFSRAKLIHADLRYAALNGATLVSANAANAKLVCASFYADVAVDSGCKNVPPKSGEPAAPANLTLVNLQQAELTGVVLDSATLTGANLSGVSAAKASLRKASLEADVAGNIEAATLQGADFSGAHFQSAHLNAVQFNYTTLADAKFDSTTLNGTNFTGAIMPGASFGGQAVLEGVNFNGALLQNAIFTDATIKSDPHTAVAVNFGCAQLGGSSFQYALVSGANFLAAVMPPASACCQKNGTAWCGTVDWPLQTYGGVAYPKLKSEMTCPNGDHAACTDAQWNIPGWKTALCNSQRTRQQVWEKPDCGSPPGETVKFKDANLKNCILSALPGHPDYIEIKTARVVLEVSCPMMDIRDLTGLDQFIGLVSLNLSGNKIAQFRLPHTQGLQKLNLSENQLSILDLTGLENLLEVDASRNQLQSVLNEVALQQVTVLDLSYNRLSTLPLSVLSHLAFVDLSHNVLTDVLGRYHTNLEALQSLGYLDISSNALETIGTIAKLSDATGLKLHIQCNPNFDCSSLKIDNDQSALENNACALYNRQAEKWILQPHPTCPGQAAPRMH